MLWIAVQYMVEFAGLHPLIEGRLKMNRHRRVLHLACILVLFTATVLGVVAFAQEKGGENETGPYDVAEGWPQPLGHSGRTWGSQGGVFAETPNRIYILQRGELPIPEKAPEGYTGGYGSFGQPATQGKPRMEHCVLVVDGNGKLLEDWTQWDHLFAGGRGPHHVKISPYDPEKHVWIVDDMLDQIFEFTHDGKELVMTLGEKGVQGADDKHFARPTDIAWLPDGTFFITTAT
jgi:hypothetical protein